MHTQDSEPRKFPLVMGDILPDGSSFSGENSDDAMSTVPSLTPNYVSAIASGEDVSSIDLPILQPTEPPKMAFEGNSNGKQTNRSHFTHFWPCDGSRNQMLGRAAMHLAHNGNRLREGTSFVWSCSLLALVCCETPQSARQWCWSTVIPWWGRRRSRGTSMVPSSAPMRMLMRGTICRRSARSLHQGGATTKLVAKQST